MAQEQKYYDVQTAAAILGITPAEVNQLRERNILRGFRDGATWKFRVEDVHQLQRQRRAQGLGEPTIDQPGSEEVLALEPERAPGDASGSGSVLGLDTGRSPGDTDLTLKPASGEELDLIDAEPGQVHAPIPRSEHEDEEIPGLAEADFTLSDAGVAEISHPASGGSSQSGILLVEEEVPAGERSDVKIGQDSGISLLDPHDSGLSLEEPIKLADEEELSLGEEDMLTIAADSVPTAAESRPEVEFQLTPTEDEYGLEDSESASQVIALAPEGVSQESPTLVAEGGLGAPFEELAPGVAPVAAPVAGMVPAAGPAMGPEAAGMAPVAMPEAPYGTLAMVMLSVTAVVLVLAGIMVVDLVRNMWSWNGPIPLNSWLMDMLAGIFG
ncbi:MAG: helix-turn-helix domain-containing protein [Thermoguttaceae bacterium]|nr:helix-turn-helix domain-containing protein [Thermoguttaceae bacterium]MDW8079914.1 helix-turn-helix domain-containing protein [Thermoguttaceae bacterium]